jgi:hypothetical protein
MHRAFIAVPLPLQPAIIESFGDGVEHYKVSVQTHFNKTFLFSYPQNFCWFIREFLREFNKPLLDVILPDLLHFLIGFRLVRLKNLKRGIYPVNSPERQEVAANTQEAVHRS